MKSFGLFLFKFIRVAAVLAVAAAGAFWLYQNRTVPQKKKVAHTPPAVRVLEAVPGPRVMRVEAFGTVKPRKTVKIAVEVPGRIESVHQGFVEGGFIREGDLIVRIDQRSYRMDNQAAAVRVRQAQVDIQSLKQDIQNLHQDKVLAEDNLRLTRQELDRVKALSKSQFASKNSLDRAEQAHLSARIQLQSIKNRLALTSPNMARKKAVLDMARVDLGKSKLALDKTEIRAPFDGFVLAKSAEQGEYVNPGQMLGTLYEKGKLDVDVRIPLEQIKWVQEYFAGGNTPEARVSPANFKGMEKLEWDAAVARIKAGIDEATRTLPITLEIGQPRQTTAAGGMFTLRPGMFVRCAILGRQYDHIFVVPRHLMKPGDRLYLVRNGKLEIRGVRVLRKFEDNVFINGGLAAGDRLISSPLPGAVDGMALTVKTNGE